MRTITQIYRHRDLILNLVRHNLTVAHRHKLLGNLWSLLNPLLMLIVLYFVFAGMRHARQDFLLYLLSGIIFWNIFITSLTAMAECLRRYKTLFMRMPLPLQIFPVVLLLERFYDIIWGLVAFFLILLGMVWFGGYSYQFNSLIFLLPVMIFFFGLYTLGIGFIIARIGAFFLDIKEIMNVVMRLGFFLSPILWYPAELLKPPLDAWYFYLYPGAGWMMLFRMALLSGESRQLYGVDLPLYIPYLIVSSLAWLIGGYLFFQARAHAYAKYV